MSGLVKIGIRFFCALSTLYLKHNLSIIIWNKQNYFIVGTYPSASRFLKILGLGEIIGLNTCWLLGIFIHGSSIFPGMGPITIQSLYIKTWINPEIYYLSSSINVIYNKIFNKIHLCLFLIPQIQFCKIRLKV